MDELKYYRAVQKECLETGKELKDVAIEKLMEWMPDLYAKLPDEFQVLENDAQVRAFGKWFEKQRRK